MLKRGLTFDSRLKKKKKRNFKSYNKRRKEEEDGEDKKQESNTFGCRGFGKDPSVETTFSPDSVKHTSLVRGRQRSKLNVKK
ncbi:unnamed protein product [Lactuca virosa]|uniref:Uncharacterized protein n=1 Tax=Lactuca virosa TaxID=75947 RepID=A0AAU9PAQ0_9ASTR|nr:unnamed protein product [Lactuca virosa]